ncbi:helix-turn-helix domain-containing protein [Streptomyces sp. NPDC001889]
MPSESLAPTAPPCASAADAFPRLPDARQWLPATSGRIASDGFSWMQAVCWFQLDGSYTRGRDHGPRRMGPTTLRVAAELARLAPCRPGVDYLVRQLTLSKRTVQYHLAVLRETGLLTYRTKGTRVRGQGGLASEFVWTIPPAFDDALHLRTGPSERYIRAVHGIDDAGRPLMKRIATMARQTLRRRRRTRPANNSPARSSAPSRCTPMGGGSSTSSTAGTTTSPSESKLETGHSPTSTPKTTKPRTLNAVGRRYRLAAQLIRQVPWLHRASVPRIAWILRHVSDAGWSVTEVIAVLGQQAPAHTVHRPSGFLARRLLGVHQLYDTPAKRQTLVAWWRDSPQAQIDRHAEWEGTWQAPRSRAVTTLVGRAIAAVRLGATPQQLPADRPELSDTDIAAHRTTAHHSFLAGDSGLITSTVDFLGRSEAERLYGTELVARALRLHHASSHLTLGASR